MKELSRERAWSSGSARPDFLVVGAAKSGTTALAAQLGSHPEIHMSSLKEPNFFALDGRPADFRGPGDRETINRLSIHDVDAYAHLFAAAGDSAVRGEASTLYLYAPRAPEAIKGFDPKMRIIAVLREPVARAFSAYRHLLRDGYEYLGFGDALEAEPRRRGENWSPIWHYAEVGRYGEQVARYLELFPRDRLRFIRYEEYRSEPLRVLRSLYQFLGVDAGHRPEICRRHNVSGTPRSRRLQRFLVGTGRVKAILRPLAPRRARAAARRAASRYNVRAEIRLPEPAVAQRLAERLESDIRSLEELLSWDLASWRLR